MDIQQRETISTEIFTAVIFGKSSIDPVSYPFWTRDALLDYLQRCYVDRSIEGGIRNVTPIYQTPDRQVYRFADLNPFRSRAMCVAVQRLRVEVPVVYSPDNRLNLTLIMEGDGAEFTGATWAKNFEVVSVEYTMGEPNSRDAYLALSRLRNSKYPGKRISKSSAYSMQIDPVIAGQTPEARAAVLDLRQPPRLSPIEMLCKAI